MPKRISVYIIDEQPVIRFGIRYFFNNYLEFEVIGDAGSCFEYLNQSIKYRPDVMIIDPNARGLGTESGVSIIRNLPGRILVYSADDEWDSVTAYIKAGGIGFVSKKSRMDELVEAVKAAASDRQWISPSVRNVNSSDFQKCGSDKLLLSPREIEIAILIAKGFTSSQIADQLCISRRTVDTHRYRLFKKLQIHSRPQLVKYAIENDLLTLSA